MKMLICLETTLVACSITLAQADAKGYVATVGRDGTLLRWFDAGMIGDQFITSVDVDRNGNYWVGRMDSRGGPFATPNEKVIKYSPFGSELLQVKGPLAAPRGTAIDSNGNIYVVGGFEFALGHIGQTAIFKYDSQGAFINSFALSERSMPDRWHDLLITADDRLFVSGELSGTIAEFTTDGNLVRQIDIGVLRFIWGLTLGASGEDLWSLDIWNGVGGEDSIAHYDLNLDFISRFDTFVVDVDWAKLRHDSIETAENGNLLVGARRRGDIELPVVHELSPEGILLKTTEFAEFVHIIEPDVKRVSVHAFTVTKEGDFVFGFNTVVPEPNAIQLWAVAGLTLLSIRRRNLRVER